MNLRFLKLLSQAFGEKGLFISGSFHFFVMCLVWNGLQKASAYILEQPWCTCDALNASLCRQLTRVWNRVCYSSALLPHYFLLTTQMQQFICIFTCICICPCSFTQLHTTFIMRLHIMNYGVINDCRQFLQANYSWLTSPNTSNLPYSMCIPPQYFWTN